MVKNFNPKSHQMWTPYKSSGIKTASGQITTAGQPGAVVGFYAYSGGTNALTVELKNGSGGTTLIKETIPAATANPVFRPFPFPGVVFSADVYLVITSTGGAEVIVFYYD